MKRFLQLISMATLMIMIIYQGLLLHFHHLLLMRCGQWQQLPATLLPPSGCSLLPQITHGQSPISQLLPPFSSAWLLHPPTLRLRPCLPLIPLPISPSQLPSSPAESFLTPLLLWHWSSTHQDDNSSMPTTLCTCCNIPLLELPLHPALVSAPKESLHHSVLTQAAASTLTKLLISFIPLLTIRRSKRAVTITLPPSSS